jgi:uncharacterized protein YndB with AHSA1/START domain
MTTKSNAIARVVRRFDATPERVFDAWLDPGTARRFLFATPAGEIVRAEIEPRVEGKLHIVDRRNGVDVEHTGTYLDINRPRHLEFVYSVDHSDQSRVSVDVAPSVSGTEVTVTHELHPDWAEFAPRAEEAWRKMLEGLAAALGEA